MLPSYQKINYGLRPAKQIERKMFCEAFRRLNELYPLKEYQYIGFGSVYFTDFALFHKALGISKMISIEAAEPANQPRFNFNRPFRCVNIKFGTSNQLLPRLDWSMPTILWLDYDRAIDKSKLEDIFTFCAEASPNSLLIVSVNATPASVSQPQNPDRVMKLRNAVGDTHIPNGIQENELAGWGTAKVVHSIITEYIKARLVDRNGVIAKNKKIHYRQLFNFQYEDGAKMQTTGGILLSQDSIQQFEKCGFDQLDFIRSSDSQDAYQINIPLLTQRELRYLDAQLPNPNHEQFEVHGIPPEMIEHYARLYRHFPNYLEVDL